MDQKLNSFLSLRMACFFCLVLVFTPFHLPQETPTDLKNATNGAIIVTVDGLDFIYIVFSGDSTAEPNYLETAFEQMNIAGVTSSDITAFEWTRDPNDTEQAVESLKVDLAGIYAQAQAQNKKLIVVGHSWGTFLTYMALAERRDIYCDLYITLSSPIGSVYEYMNSSCWTDEAINYYVGGFLLGLGYFDSPIRIFNENLPNTGKWINVWAWGDTISGRIPNCDYDIKVDPLDSEGLLRCQQRAVDVVTFDFQWHNFTKLLPGGSAYGYSNQQTIDEIRSIIEQTIDSAPPMLGSWMSGTWSPGTKIYIGFSELLAENTINESTITVNGSASGPVSWNYQFEPDIFRLTLTPLDDFIAGETVTVTITEGVEDLIGNGFDGDHDGQPGPSFQFTFNISDVAPSGPTDLVATAGSSTVVNLSWDSNSTDEDGFIVERRIPPSSTWVEEGTTGPGVTTYQDWGLSSGTSYCYRVKSFKGEQESDPSNEDCATPTNTDLPAAPSQLSAISVSGSQINLSWVDNASNEENFRIERRIGWNGDWIWFTTVGANTQTYQDTGLSVGLSYGYRVRAANSHGVSAFSNEAVATTSEVLPAAPSNLTAQAVTDTRIRLSWKDNANNENGFEIERKTGSSGTWGITGYAGRNETSFEDSVSSNTTYYFRVKAHNSVGYSGYSNEANTTSCVAPDETFLSNPYSNETGVSTTVTLEWLEDPDAVTQYDIYLGPSSEPPYVASVAGAVDEYTVSGLSGGTQYFWKLVAHAACNPSLTSTSDTRTFFTLGGPSPVTLLKPADGATGISTGVVLDWANISDPGSFQYDLYFGTTDPPPFFEAMGSRTEKLMSSLTANTHYYWRVLVKATDDPNLTNTSPTWDFITGAASSTTVDVRAFKDAGLRGGSFGNTNYGGAVGGTAEQRLFGCGNTEDMFQDPGAAPIRGVVQFDLSSIPTGSTISNATLTLYFQMGDPNTSALDIYFDPLTGTWSEGSITWNNCPGVNTAYQVKGVFPTSGYNPLQNDITTLVQAWVNGTISNNGIRISIPAWESLTSKYKSFSQREDFGGANTAAKLSVTYQTPCSAPAAPSSPVPTHGASGQAHCVTLGWSEVANCQGYKVYIGSPTPAFHSMVTTNSATVCDLPAGTTYSWRIEAMADCDGSVVSTSSTWSFSTAACLEPLLPSLSAPASGSAGQPMSVNLSWSAASGAGQYEVFCGLTNPPTQSLGTTTSTALTAGGLAPQTTYFWQVKASAACNPALVSSSAVWNFTTGAPPPLVANYTYAPTTVNAGQQVQFTDASTGSPAGWLWNFGDGTTSSQQNPSHTFATGGSYTVKLTVSNAYGSNFCNQILTAVDYTLTTSVSSGGGRVSPAGTTRHNPGAQVSLMASPDPCYVFDHWSGDIMGNTNPVQFNITQNMSVSAAFIEGQVIGDLDGTCTINSSDLLLLAAYLNGEVDLSGVDLLQADCNADGLVNVSDLVILINYLNGNIATLPLILDPHFEAGNLYSTDSIVGNLRYVPDGSFVQGSPALEPCRDDEELQFTHTLTRKIAVMETEVTRQMWADLKSRQPTLPADPTDPSCGAGMNHPVQRVAWFETVLFANLLSLQQGLTRCYYTDADLTQPIDATNYQSDDLYCDFNANGYRLPTEGEWEYCCRGGSSDAFSIVESKYSSSNCNLDIPLGTLSNFETVAWFLTNSPSGTQAVGSKAYNPWNLKDMHGNVWEWVWDPSGAYPLGSATDYPGAAGLGVGGSRMYRGGSWGNYAMDCRSASRYGTEPFTVSVCLGFRLVRTVSVLPPTPPAPPVNGLRAYYPLDGNATDESWYNWNGSISGATPTTDWKENADSAFLFDQSSENITVASSLNGFDWAQNTSLTLAAWIRVDDFAAYSMPVVCTENSVWQGFGLYIYTNSIMFLCNDSFITASTTITPGTWYHVAVVNDLVSDTLRFYVNGDLLHTSPNAGTVSMTGNGLLKISSETSNPSRYFHGAIDEVRIYDRALTDAQIHTLISVP